MISLMAPRYYWNATIDSIDKKFDSIAHIIDVIYDINK